MAADGTGEEPEWRRLNRASWDERTPLHVASTFYDVPGFVAGRPTLRPFEAEELGPVAGRTLVHLQCHFGLDTLSWARRGALVTGLDFSAPAVDEARRLAATLGLDARFEVGDVYQAAEVLGRRYDIVYTGTGALCWLPDVPRWARVVAELLEPGGRLYLVEFHPVLMSLAEDGLDWAFDYFGLEGRPFVEDSTRTYADPQARLANTVTHQFAHPLGEVVTALIDAGLRLDFLHEQDQCSARMWPFLEGVPGERAMYRLPAGYPRLPLGYSLRATYPA